MKDNSKLLLSRGVNPGEFAFLIHNFIVSTAGALSFAKPNFDKIRIDSTWGIVEGLYYHPHDSFEISLESKTIIKKVRCKDKYIDVNEDGNWYSNYSGLIYDYKQSLTENQIETIGAFTQKIADYLEKPVTVMFFINNKKHYPEILPWYYSDEVPQKATNYTEIIFSQKNIEIKTKNDLATLRESVYIQQSKKRIKLNLDIDIIRDTTFINEIGSFAKQENYVVDLEGSILSHPYYVLTSLGVEVHCLNPLDPTYTHREFYKLVRDKIPVKIKNNDESVITTKVTSSELLNMLKEKAVEEALELYWSKGNDEVIEEMADIWEVLLSICKAYGIQFEEIINIAKRKRDKRGGFDEGIVLIATKENSLFHLINKNLELFPESPEEEFEKKLKQVSKFFQKGEINNFKSLTEVDKISIPYVNYPSSKFNKFRYLLKKELYNSLHIQYKERIIEIKLEKLNLDSNPSQLNLFDNKSEN